MRILIWGSVILAALWSAWWWVAATQFHSRLDRWAENRRAAGWHVSLGKVKVTGFPLTFQVRLSDVAVSDPARFSIETNELNLKAPAHWPANVTLELPQTPVALRAADQSMFLQTTDGQVRLKVHPGLSLELEAARAESGPWLLNSPRGNLAEGEGFDLLLQQDTLNAATYHLDLDAPELVPGDLIRLALQLPESWPQVLDASKAKMSVTFDAPLNRHVSRKKLPQPRQVTLHDVQVIWGPVGFTSEGAVEIDVDGVPEGAISLRVQNWPEILDLAAKSGVLPAKFRPQAETMLTALSNFGGDAETLDLTLQFTDGKMALGPIRLGPAPRLILR